MIKKSYKHEFKKLLDSSNSDTLNITGVLNYSNPNIYTDSEKSGVWFFDGSFNYIFTNEKLYLEKVTRQILTVLNESIYLEISGCNKVVRDYLDKNHLIHWINPCYNLVLRNPIYTRSDLKFEMDSLTVNDVEFVNENYEYRSEYSLERIRNAIVNGPTSCIRVDGLPVSYAAINDDGSIGYMYTLKEHRGKGYAFEVSKDISMKVIERGLTPFVQIHQGNSNSLNLALKAGFERANDVYWMGIINTEGKDLGVYKRRFKELFASGPTHISTRLYLEKGFELETIEMEIKEDFVLITYQSEEFYIKYFYENEIYYLKPQNVINVNLLKTALIKLMRSEDDICLIGFDNCVNDSGLVSIEDK